MSDLEILRKIVTEDVSLELVEAGIYSVYPVGERPGAYDKLGVSTVYDLFACNRFYNWLMWGYSIKEYPTFCEDTISLSSDGWVLDLACGSLAFTAETYLKFNDRPVIFLDQSLNLLRKGKSRLEKLKANTAENMYFLQADALKLPFRSNVFNTIIAFNLLHCIGDVKASLSEIKRVLKIGGHSAMTTLVKSSRWSNRYINMLAESGALISRSCDELLSDFDEMEMLVTTRINGNLAFIKYG